MQVDKNMALMLTVTWLWLLLPGIASVGAVLEGPAAAATAANCASRRDCSHNGECVDGSCRGGDDSNNSQHCC